MTIDELMKALECHVDGNKCNECPYFRSGRCSEDMARAALDALNTKNELLDQYGMPLKAIRMALDKDYNIIITPTTCEIRLMPKG